MSDHQHAACKALATADVGAVEVLAARSDSTAPPFNTTRRKEEVMIAPTKSKKPTITNAILADRILLDLIERLEEVRDLLDEEMDVPGYFQILAQNALRATIDYLTQLRERRLARNQ
jgi:hypothetical protein